VNDLPINVTDLAVLAILLFSALLALLRGFVAEVLSVMAWIGALAVAFYQFPLLQPYVTQWTGVDGDLAAFGAGAILFVVSVIVFSILARVVTAPLKTYTLGAVDRSLGVLFGLARGALLVSFAYLLVQWVLPNADDRPAWITEARTRPYLEVGAEELRKLVPEHMRTEADLQRERTLRQMEEEAHRRVFDTLNNPQPAADPKDDAPTSDPGYTDEQRQELNRAIQGTQ